MLIYYDESGDFNLNKANAISIVGSLICPESQINLLNQFHAHIIAKLKVNNLHGKNIQIKERLEICTFFNKNRHFKATVSFVNENRFDNNNLKEFREEQAKLVEENKSDYLKTLQPDNKIIDDYSSIIKKMKFKSKLSDDNFLQLFLTIENFKLTVRHLLSINANKLDNNDFNKFKFVFDRKLKKKLSHMDKFLKLNISRMISSSSQLNIIPPLKINHSILKNTHFVGKYINNSALNLNNFLDNNIIFEKDDNEIGLQFVDVICNTIYRGLKNRKNQELLRCYELLKPILYKNNNLDLHGIAPLKFK